MSTGLPAHSVAHDLAASEPFVSGNGRYRSRRQGLGQRSTRPGLETVGCLVGLMPILAMSAGLNVTHRCGLAGRDPGQAGSVR